MLKRQQAVFWPTGKTRRVTGIRVCREDGSPIVFRSASAIQIALRDYWAPVYSAKEMVVHQAVAFLNLYDQRNTSHFYPSSLELPGKEELHAAIKHAEPNILPVAMMVSQLCL